MVVEQEEGHRIAQQCQVLYVAQEVTHSGPMLGIVLPTCSLLLLSLPLAQMQGSLAWEERGVFKGLNTIELNLGFHLPRVILCKEVPFPATLLSLTYLSRTCFF